MAKARKGESLAALLAHERPGPRPSHVCSGCSNPANAELIEALEQMARGELDPSYTISQLYTHFRKRAAALGAPYNMKETAFKRHVTECHSERWEAVKEARQR